MRTLYGLKQSAWTEKAAWALDHHSIEHRFVEHLPMLGELRLRFHGTKTVPLLVGDGKSVAGSLAIARHADESARASLLFTGDPAIERFVELSDRMIDVGRSRILVHLATDRAAQVEALPSFVPNVFAATSGMAARFLIKKHGVPTDVAVQNETVLVPCLDEVRAALAGKSTLVGTGFTFADIAIAAALRAVAPEARAEIGPETRKGWTDPALAERYADLLAWRDALYAKYR